MNLENQHPSLPKKKTGILLINLGTPDSTNWFDIRRYLKEFLSDKRVIEVNPILWQIILNLFILTFRPSKTAKAYKKIWMKKQNMSPLRYFTIKQTSNLQKRMKNKVVEIDFAMRYGNPGIAKKLSELKEKGCQEMIVLPLYPQYAAATTATAQELTFTAQAVKTMSRNVMSRTVMGSALGSKQTLGRMIKQTCEKRKASD